MSKLVQLELLSYDDSLFTNAHDVVSHEPVIDGRGTFSHLGVRMEGLESSRHFNLKHEKDEEGNYSFFKDHTVVNNIILGVRGPSTRMLVHAIELDTSFYTRNPTKDIYCITLIDELENTQKVVAEHLGLEGNASFKLELDKPVPTTKIVLRTGEGGLARIKVFGEPLDQLPPKTNILKDAKVFAVSDASYGEPSLVLRELREGIS